MVVTRKSEAALAVFRQMSYDYLICRIAYVELPPLPGAGRDLFFYRQPVGEAARTNDGSIVGWFRFSEPPETKSTMLAFIPTFPNIGFLFGGVSGNFTLFGIGGLSLCSESSLPMLLFSLIFMLIRKFYAELPT